MILSDIAVVWYKFGETSGTDREAQKYIIVTHPGTDI